MVLLIIFTIIQLVITLQFMIIVGGVIANLKYSKLQYWGFRLIAYPPVAFGLNMLISVIMKFFTDSGMAAGFANLTSGVIAMLLNRMVLDYKFNITEINQLYEESRENKKHRSAPITPI